MHLNYSIITTISYLISNTYNWSFMTPKTVQTKRKKGSFPTHQKEPPTFQANIITFNFIYFIMAQMQHRRIKSTKNNSSFLMAFSLLKDIGASRAPHQKVGRQVMYTKNISCHNKKKEKRVEKNTTN